jgi:hypothetical protein
MRKPLRPSILAAALAVSALLLMASAALAVSNAHFVGTPTASRSDNTLTISGKVAGLGDVDVITVTISGDALCINPGSNHPKATNKAALAGGANVPVQNGKANFSVPATATFQPSCSPPMTVVFQNVTVTVTAADGTNLVFRFPGTL